MKFQFFCILCLRQKEIYYLIHPFYQVNILAYTDYNSKIPVQECLLLEGYIDIFAVLLWVSFQKDFDYGESLFLIKSRKRTFIS